MNIEGINWDEVPETLSLEQLYQLIHVSKRVAKSLVENEIPCIMLAPGDFDHHGTTKNNQSQLT